MTLTEREKQMTDETLMQEMRERLLAEGLDEDSVEMLIEDLDEDGMFDV